MRDVSWFIAVVVLAAPFSSCTPSLPTAPDLSPVLEAFANPTAVVTSEVMAVVADGIAATAEEIEDSEIFEQILNVIIQAEEELQAAIRRTCNGGANNGNACDDDAECPGGTCGDASLVLGAVCSGGTNADEDCFDDGDCPGGSCVGGVTLPSPTGAFRIDYICPGWDERQFDPEYDSDPDSANGSIDLNMTLDSKGIGQVAWGEAKNCLYLLPNAGDDCEAAGCTQGSYDGGIALDLGPDWLGREIEQLPVTFVVEGNIGLDGDDFRINQSFRLILAVESALEILVDIGDPALTETFNYFFAADAQAIRDATGLFGCSLEESQCFEQTCEGGANDGRACSDDVDCPEGTCERRELFSW